MPSSKKKTNDWLLMWDITGLECIVDLSSWKREHEQWTKEVIWDILKESQFRSIEPKIPLQQMILRAKTNPQRHYEIYTFSAEYSITEKTLRTLFERDPQHIVDLVRKKGSKVYSDRLLIATTKDKLIL
jgi:hypothetical protein